MAGLALLQLAAGVALVIAAWLIPRRVAEAPVRFRPALLLDVAPFVLGAAWGELLTARPLFAGLVALALGAGFALADDTMRKTLREPVVFSEAVELPQVFTHPQLYLPFAGPGLVIGGAVGAAVAALALLVLEPPLWPPHPMLAAGLLVLGVALLWGAAREPLLGLAARLLRRLAPSGEPFADATSLGPFAMLIVHAVIARSERRARQAALAAPPLAPAILTPMPIRERDDAGGPIILVQCESFFDARRLSPMIPRELLAGYDACCAGAASFGRLEVPGWGANTMRTEFAVLSGVPERELGYDRFNPYYALARVPLESQVWRLRRAGYRTICLHPFDRRFFRRDLAMPALGFERFLARETLGGSQAPPYCSDPELAGHILRVLDAEGPRSFIFAITMGNHGPWLSNGVAMDPAVAAILDSADVPGGGELLRYLDGLRRSDEMLRLLRAGLEERGMTATLAFYGDHLPSLPVAFEHFGFTEPHSDYVIWPGIGSGEAQRCDLPAHDLARVIVDAALAPACDAAACRVGAEAFASPPFQV